VKAELVKMALIDKKGAKRVQKGRKNVPFCTLVGFNAINTTLLERMAGTTRLELATSAVTASIKR
jgi:phage/plasmid primase-like uncharacterized protein